MPLPGGVALLPARLHVDQRVRLSVEEGAIIIRPEQSADVTLEERLSRFDPVRHGGHNGNEKIRTQHGLKFACNYHSLLISE
jgi:hypothetical protein